MTIEEANKFLQNYKKSNNLNKDNFEAIREKSEEYYGQFRLTYAEETDIVKLEQADLIYAFNYFIEETGKFSVSYFLNSVYYKTHFLCKNTKNLKSKRASVVGLEGQGPENFILDFANMGQKNEERFSDSFNIWSFAPSDTFKRDLKLLSKGVSNIRKLTNGAFIPVLIPENGIISDYSFDDCPEETLVFVYDESKMKPKELLRVLSESDSFDYCVCGEFLSGYENQVTVFEQTLKNEEIDEFANERY